MARPLVVNSRILIPAQEFSLSFARSSGPGGQNVNKVNTKALLRWSLIASPSLPDEVKSRFLKRYPQRLNAQGEVLLTSDRHRDQSQNIADCYAKLRQLLLSVLAPPRVRKKSKPTRGAIEKRLEQKRQRSQRKQQRRYRPGGDD